MPRRPARTRVSLRDFGQHADWAAFRSVVSLHAHTSHSREELADLAACLARIPVVATLFARQLEATAQLAGGAIDFSKGWWHPPVSSREVFESEWQQIERRFGLEALVSVTDHDSIEAGFELQKRYAATCAPISCEWTVPFGNDFFHVGVHNLPPHHARAWFARLAARTAGTGVESSGSILRDLARTDGVLLVLNHPLWDLGEVGASVHLENLRRFLAEHRESLHALELNGYRSRNENGGVRTLSAESGLPLISGGDRHAGAPNAMLNVTGAATFAEFVDEVRDGTSHVVLMPEYRRHLAIRKLAAASEVLRHYRAHPAGRRRWVDRVSCEWRGCVHPLSYYWPTGGPLWVRSTISMFRVLTSPVPLSILRAALERAREARGGRIPRAVPVEMSTGVFRLDFE